MRHLAAVHTLNNDNNNDNILHDTGGTIMFVWKNGHSGDSIPSAEPQVNAARGNNAAEKWPHHEISRHKVEYSELTADCLHSVNDT